MVATFIFCSIFLPMTGIAVESAAHFFQFWFISSEFFVVITFFAIFLTAVAPKPQVTTSCTRHVRMNDVSIGQLMFVFLFCASFVLCTDRLRIDSGYCWNMGGNRRFSCAETEATQPIYLDILDESFTVCIRWADFSCLLL